MLVSRALLGFAFSGIYAVIESWIHAKASNTNRGALYGVYQIVNFVASASGQLLLRGLDPNAFVPFTIGASLFALGIVPLAMTRADAPEAPRNVSLRLLRLLDLPRFRSLRRWRPALPTARLSRSPPSTR